MAKVIPGPRWIPVPAALVILWIAAGSAPGQKTVVAFEKAPDRVARPEILGTRQYAPRKAEKPFFDRLAPKERTTGNLFRPYDPKGRKGKFVSWFGVVRDIKHTPDGLRLHLEHKYFDSMTDLHLQVVSLHGCGDFAAKLTPKKMKDAKRIRCLELVRLYGKVVDEKDGIPVIAVEYARVFPWKTFTFMHYGKDQRREKWKKLTRVSRDEVYSAAPTNRYYEDRLGPRKKAPDESD